MHFLDLPVKRRIWSWILLILLGLTTANSCDKDPIATDFGKDGYFVFGYFYGFCAGPECIRIYKIQGDDLYEDIEKAYPERGRLYNGSFEKVENHHIDSISHLLSGFPEALLNDTNDVFGCPDCVDQGGIYLEIKTGGIHRSWLLDNSNSALPDYLQNYAVQVRRAIDLSRDQ